MRLPLLQLLLWCRDKWESTEVCSSVPLQDVRVLQVLVSLQTVKYATAGVCEAQKVGTDLAALTLALSKL